jgi:hypothetical protein
MFVLMKHYYSLEAFLSFNARPVISDRLVEALRPAPRVTPALNTVEVGFSTVEGAG